jgi:hypothetical protein
MITVKCVTNAEAADPTAGRSHPGAKIPGRGIRRGFYGRDRTALRATLVLWPGDPHREGRGMAEPTVDERLGGIFANAAVVDNAASGLPLLCPDRTYGVLVTRDCRRGQIVQPAVMAISTLVSAMPGRYIRVRGLTVSSWWPR